MRRLLVSWHWLLPDDLHVLTLAEPFDVCRDDLLDLAQVFGVDCFGTQYQRAGAARMVHLPQPKPTVPRVSDQSIRGEWVLSVVRGLKSAMRDHPSAGRSAWTDRSPGHLTGQNEHNFGIPRARVEH